jgi:CRISPR-associated protein Cmr3
MKLLFTPVDSWFFRDSTPFDMDAAPQARVRGVFPPYPSTVAGAVRAALARVRGWNGKDTWSEAIKPVLGDGPDDLGRLQLTGPLVVRSGETLFPLPRYVSLARDRNNGRAVQFICPGQDQISTDLGSSRLPELAAVEHGGKSAIARPWITAAGLRKLLQHQSPAQADIVNQDAPWCEELHVGIRRDLETRTTGEGALYSTRHTRLRPGVGLAVEASGLPDDWSIPPGTLMPLGGESRLAVCQPWQSELKFQLDHQELGGECVLIALTPALIEHAALCGRADLITEPRVRVICGCAERPLRIGGWDSLARRPLPLRNALPAGTTLFCSVDDPGLLIQRATDGLIRIGAGQSAGFGLFVIGRWSS